MTAPFIFIGTHKIKPGKREEFKKYFAQFSSDVVEPEEPRLHSFYGYAAPDSDYVTIVQVHPDADSMATHMKVGMEHFATAYAEYLEPESSLQIYGNLTEDLIRDDLRRRADRWGRLQRDDPGAVRRIRPASPHREHR